MSNGTIVYLGGFELPDKNAAAHRVLSNGKILRKKGYKVIFIDSNKSEKPQSNEMKKKEIQSFETWSVRYPNNVKEWIKYLTTVEEYIKIIEKQKKIDAVICYNLPAIKLHLIIKYCKKNNIKIISDITEWYGMQGKNIIWKIIKGFDSFLRMRVLNKRVDGVIAISTLLYEYYSNKTRTIIIPPLVDLNEKKWNRESIKTNEDRVTFTYSGSPSKEKEKLDYIIEIFSELNNKNFYLNIVGINKKQLLEMYPHLNAIIENIGDNLNIFGRVSHIESLEILKSSDFSVFFRNSNLVTNAGFPTKLSESVSARVPVITNEYSDVSKYIIEGTSGFVIDELDKKTIKKTFETPIETLKAVKEKMPFTTFHYEEWESILIQFLQDI